MKDYHRRQSIYIVTSPSYKSHVEIAKAKMVPTTGTILDQWEIVIYLWQKFPIPRLIRCTGICKKKTYFLVQQLVFINKSV